MLGRHLDWCLDTARALGAELEGPRVQDALAALDADVDNLRAAMDWGVTHGRGLDAARIVAATSWYWVWRGRIVETERWLQPRRHRRHDARPDRSPGAALGEERAHRQSCGGIADLVAEGLELARAHHDLRAEARPARLAQPLPGLQRSSRDDPAGTDRTRALPRGRRCVLGGDELRLRGPRPDLPRPLRSRRTAARSAPDRGPHTASPATHRRRDRPSGGCGSTVRSLRRRAPRGRRHRPRSPPGSPPSTPRHSSTHRQPWSTSPRAAPRQRSTRWRSCIAATWSPANSATSPRSRSR